MAISNPTNLTTGGDDTNALVYTTASVTLTAGRLYLLAISAARGAGIPDSPTISNNNTWNQSASVTWGASNVRKLLVFRCLAASTTTATIIITFPTNQCISCSWSLIEITSGFDTSGVNGLGALGQGGSNSGLGLTSLTVTLGAFQDAVSIALGFFAIDIASDIVPAGSFTELGEDQRAAPAGTLESCWFAGDADPGVTFAMARAAGIGTEIKQPLAVVATVPKLRLSPHTKRLNLRGNPL